MSSVVLVNMPFAAVQRPSLALGLLTAYLQEVGIPVKAVYANLRFFERIGMAGDTLFSARNPNELLGDWVFSQAAFGEQVSHKGTPSPSRAFPDLGAALTRKLLGIQQLHTMDEYLLFMRDSATAFVDELSTDILKMNPAIVGCTSMFEQHTASLAILRRIKERAPHVITMIGGANCAGRMGHAAHHAFPWIDYTATGEIDNHFGTLCTRILENPVREHPTDELPPNILGPAHRHPAHTKTLPPHYQLNDMDTAAIPAFDDYFNAVSQMPTAKYIDPCITLETSRGCWWGAKNHCTFCGLNALGMAFRKKSPTRAVSEIREVTTRHNVYNWHATDNIIDMSYFDSVLPQLAEDDNPYRFFYETKANLKVHHLQSLVNAGCDFIQPGIESLHDETLKIMRKGTTACLNIHLLRLCVSLGIRAQWSILCGFPDSNPAWVSEVAEKFGSLHHLQPPACVNEIRFDRFSPYHSQQTTFGLELTPFEAYERIYPLDKQSLEDLAFFFEGKVAPEVHTHTAKAQQTVLKWRKAFWSSARPQLSFESSTIESARIKDTRECATSPLHELDGLEAAVLHCVDTPVTVRGLARRLSTAGWKHVSTAEIDRALDELDAHALIWRSSTQIVALPSPACQRPMASSARKGLGDVRFPEYLRDQKRFQDLFL